MQWSPEPNGGFTNAKHPVAPAIDDGVFDYKLRNAAALRRDPGSFLNWTERIIRMRKECPEIGWGDWQVLPARTPNVLVLRYDWRGNTFVALHNLDAKPHTARFTISGGTRSDLVNLLSAEHSESDRRGAHTIVIEGYGYRWYRVKMAESTAPRRRSSTRRGAESPRTNSSRRP